MPLLSTQIQLQIVGGETKALGVDDTLAVFPKSQPLLSDQVILQSGTGSARAEKVGMASFSLTGGASLTLDLQAFAGPYGNVAFTSIKERVIDNQSTLAADVIRAGDDGTVVNPWTSPYGGSGRTELIFPGAPDRKPAPLGGMAVTPTNRNLKLVNLNSGTNVASGNVILIGEGT